MAKIQRSKELKGVTKMGMMSWMMGLFTWWMMILGGSMFGFGLSGRV